MEGGQLINHAGGQWPNLTEFFYHGMRGTLTFAGRAGPMQPDSLGSMRDAVQAPWQGVIVDFLERWWGKKLPSLSRPQVQRENPDRSRMPSRTWSKAPAAPSLILRIDTRHAGGIGHARSIHWRHDDGGARRCGRMNPTAVQPQSTPQLGADLDFAALTPAQAQAWQQAYPDEWASCKQLLVGGQAPVAWLNGAQGGPVVHEGFGMTETISHFAVRQLHPNHENTFNAFADLPSQPMIRNALRIEGPDGPNTSDERRGRNPKRSVVPLARSFRRRDQFRGHQSSAAVEHELTSRHHRWPFKCYGEPHPQWGQARCSVSTQQANPPMPSGNENALRSGHGRTCRHTTPRSALNGCPSRPPRAANGNDREHEEFYRKTRVGVCHNPNKAREVQQMLGDAYVIKTLTDIGCHEAIPETAETLEGNARIKAMHVVEHYGLDCFADDTGLEVEALNGKPGALRGMLGKMPMQRKTRPNCWRNSAVSTMDAIPETSICLVRGGVEERVEGVCKGRIAQSGAGSMDQLRPWCSFLKGEPHLPR